MSEAADRLKHRLKTGTLGGDQDERDVEQVIAERESLERRLADETAIVDRIWDIYGRPSYKELAGRTIYDLINADRAALAQKTRECELRDGTLNMAVARLGGIVEGNPTGRHNFLQRIDELVAKEKDSYFPLYKSAKERVFALENELSDAKKQLAGCSCAARDYEAALQYGEGVGFGDEFKKVLICRQSLDYSQAQVEQLERQVAELSKPVTDVTDEEAKASFTVWNGWIAYALEWEELDDAQQKRWKAALIAARAALR